MFITKVLNITDLPVVEPEVHPSLVSSIIASNAGLISQVAIIIVLRIYTRLVLAKHLYVEDYLMILSAIFFFITASVNIAATPWGFGLTCAELPGATIEERLVSAKRVLEYNFISMVFIVPCICLAKLSIIATQLHIFTSRTSSLLRHILIVTAVVMVASSFAQVVFVIFQCTTVSLSWELIDGKHPGSCRNLEEAVIWGGVINVVTDWVICCAPIPFFMRLQLPLRQRLGVSALFLVGLLAPQLGVLRVVKTHGLEDNPDVTYAVAPYFNASVAEAAVCIITGSVPALRPLLATILPNFFDSYRLDDLAANLKDNIRRATSRQSSRRRADFDTISEFRQQSTVSAGKQDWSDVEKNESRRDDDSNSAETSRGWYPRSAWYRARRAVANFCKALKGPSQEELTRGRRGRPLSVINELDEASNEIESEKGRVMTVWDHVTGLFKQDNGTSSLADAKRRLASLELPRLSGSAGTKAKGSIIVITEITVSGSKRDLM